MSDVGVVIATRNRATSLRRTLSELLALPERPPIVVVDNGSTDQTVAVAHAAGPPVTLIELGHNAGPAARTIGVRSLATSTVAFADDDSWWAPGALALAAQLLDHHPRLALIAARILVGDDQRLDPTCSAMAHSPLPGEPGLPGPPVLGFIACGAIVRRSAYLEVGGFMPRFGFGGEEQVLALDLASRGWQLAYVDGVVAHHHPSARSASRELRPASEIRNELWSAWLRRRPRTALSTTLAVGRQSVRGGQTAALIEALRGLPWALSRRRRLPGDVEAAVELLA